MSQGEDQDSESTNAKGMFCPSGLNCVFKHTYFRSNLSLHYPLFTWTHSSKEEPLCGDNSGPLFSIYSKSVEKNDNVMCERWQKDADGMIIFVRMKVTISTATY